VQNIWPTLRLSSLASLAGWGAGMLYCCPVTLWFTGIDRGAVAICFWIGLLIAALIFGVWLVALLPLSIVVPSGSVLWRKHVLAPLGFFAGLGIAAAILFLNALNNENDWPPDMYDWHINFINNIETLGPPSAIVGLVTCLAGAILHRAQSPLRNTASK
jgi:hypothetical protein